MGLSDNMLTWLTELLPAASALFAFLYGVWKITKKYTVPYLQFVIMGVGCFSLSGIYRICWMLTGQKQMDGNLVSYLGYAGCFLFLLSINYGQIDGLLDDNSVQKKSRRVLALLAPLTAVLLYLPCLLGEVPGAVKLSYGFVWIPAAICSYYNFKHVIIDDLGNGFVKAVRPYNMAALLLIFCKLVSLLFNVHRGVPFGAGGQLLLAIVIGILCICLPLLAERGVKQWTE